eukprot:gene180-311_t
MIKLSNLNTWSIQYMGESQSNRILKSQELIMSMENKKINNFITALSKITGSIRLAMSIREDMQKILKGQQNKVTSPQELYKMDYSLSEYLRAALCQDSLQIERVTFDDSSGALLEKVAKFESVHVVRSLSELKRRLHHGRRCYAFFHPSMPTEPLTFIHIALTNVLATSIP